MLVDTYRFGPLEAPDNKLITMERPILGFEGLCTFCLIEVDDIAPFLWLQSTEDPTVAFLVVNPVLFSPDYRVVVNPKEISELNVSDVTAVETYVIVTVNDARRQVTANLQGPILVNTETNLAKQLVLVNSDYKVDHLILEDITPAEKPEAAEPAAELEEVGA